MEDKRGSNIGAADRGIQPNNLSSPSVVNSFISFLNSNPDITSVQYVPFTSPPYRQQFPFLGLDYVKSDDRFSINSWWDRKEEEIIALVSLSSAVEGPPGGVHGGCIAAIFDVLSPYPLHHFGLWQAYTAQLNISFLAMIPLNSTVQCRAQIEKVLPGQSKGSKIWITAEMRSIPADPHSTSATTLYARCNSLWITSSNFNLSNQRRGEEQQRSKKIGPILQSSL